MNVYDFDNTIYDGDCTIDFWKHCIKKYPKIICTLPSTMTFAILFYLKLCKREQFKQKFYTFLKYVPDVQKEVKLFWNTHIKNIKRFYYQQKRHDDVIVSASPDFLIAEVCKRLKIQYIASKVNVSMGALESPNCRGNEKVKRFRKKYPNAQIQNFYSDTLSDIFLAKQAQHAFFVKKNVIKKWRL